MNIGTPLSPNATKVMLLGAGELGKEVVIELQRLGADTFDYGNNLRGHAKEAGLENAFAFEGFVPKYVRPLFCEGKGPFRWAALSGNPEDIYKTDARVKELIPDDPHLHNWLDMARIVRGQTLSLRNQEFVEAARALGIPTHEVLLRHVVELRVPLNRDGHDGGRIAGTSGSFDCRT